MELDLVGGANAHITETTHIQHRRVAGLPGADDALLTIGGIDFWHTDTTRERFQQKLIREWVRAGWAADVQTILLEEIASANRPDELPTQLGGAA